MKYKYEAALLSVLFLFDIWKMKTITIFLNLNLESSQPDKPDYESAEGLCRQQHKRVAQAYVRSTTEQQTYKKMLRWWYESEFKWCKMESFSCHTSTLAAQTCSPLPLPDTNYTSNTIILSALEIWTQFHKHEPQFLTIQT